MLFLGVDGFVVVVEVVEAEVFRDKKDSLPVGKLIDDVLEFSEEIYVVFEDFGSDDASSEGLDHLQLLEDGVDVADAAKVHDAHLFLASVD